MIFYLPLDLSNEIILIQRILCWHENFGKLGISGLACNFC